MVKRLLVVEVYGHRCVVIEKTTIHAKVKMSRSSKALVNRKTIQTFLKKKKLAYSSIMMMTKMNTNSVASPYFFLDALVKLFNLGHRGFVYHISDWIRIVELVFLTDRILSTNL